MASLRFHRGFLRMIKLYRASRPLVRTSLTISAEGSDSPEMEQRSGVSPCVPPPARDDDLEWLLTVAPSLLGCRSYRAGITAVLEGGAGAYDSSAAEAHVERARSHVARARRLSAVWARLDPSSRKVLTTYYQA